MTDQIQITQKGYWVVEGTNHSAQTEAFQDAGSRAVAAPGAIVHVQPPAFDVVYTAPSVSQPPNDPPPTTTPPPTTPALAAGFDETQDGFTFEITDTSVNAVKVHYDFADGKSANSDPGATISHTYPDTSQRKITQTVTDADGATASTFKIVYPRDPSSGNPPPDDPPPSDPPPTSPPPSNHGVPTNGIPSLDGTTIPYPLTNSGPGTAKVVVNLLDGTVWTASANVSGNCQDAPQRLIPADANGSPHPWLVVDFFGDGALLCNDKYTSPKNIDLSFSVSFNGAVIYQSVPNITLCTRTAFWPIRWSYCGYQPIDLAKCPEFGPTVPGIPDWSKFIDLRINGRGPYQYVDMGTASDHGGIGLMHAWGATFAKRPCDSAWAALRIAEDSGGTVWPWRARDPDTLEPIYIQDYPNATLQKGLKLPSPRVNPIVNGGDCQFIVNRAHLAHFNAAGYAASGSAFDRDALIHMANYAILGANPMYRGETGGQGLVLLNGAPRVKAWCVAASLWAAALLPEGDKYKTYHDGVCKDNAGAFAMAYLGDTSRFTSITYPNSNPITPNQWANPMHVFRDGAAYGHAPVNGGAAYAGWQHDYYVGVVDWATEKLGYSEWKPVRDWFAAYRIKTCNEAPYECASSYTQNVAPVAAPINHSPPLPYFDNYADGFAQASPALVGLESGSQALYDALKKSHPALPKPGDMIGSPSPDEYEAVIRQSVAAAVNGDLAGATDAWAKINSAPTAVKWNVRFDIVPVPRAAA